MKSILSLLFLAILSLSCNDNKKLNQVERSEVLPIYQVKSEDATVFKEFPAAIQGIVDIEIRPQVSGTLEKIFIDEGDYIIKGQPLFKINDNPFIEQLNGSLANLNEAQASLTNAQLEVEKLTPLVANKVVAEYQLKTAKANLKIAKARVDYNNALAGTAKINLGYTLIKSPFNGYIGRLPKKLGSQISPTDSEALTILSDVQEVYAYFSISESDFINFKSQYSGNSISEKLKKIPAVSLVLADNTIYEKDGKIDMIDGQFNKNTGAITLRAKFPNQKGMLRSGNTGKVKLKVVHKNAVAIPQESTIEIQDKTFVFLLNKENKVSKQPITISASTETHYLVSDGLKIGDRIITRGFENLKDGTIVTPENVK